MLAAITEEKPDGIRYTAYRVGVTATFLVLLELPEDSENPLPAIPAVRSFQEKLRGGLPFRPRWISSARSATTDPSSAIVVSRHMSVCLGVM
jgi:hypothetical protein